MIHNILVTNSIYAMLYSAILFTTFYVMHLSKISDVINDLVM